MKKCLWALVSLLALMLAAPASADLLCEDQADVNIMFLHTQSSGNAWFTTLGGYDGIGNVGSFDMAIDTPDATDLASYDMVIVAINTGLLDPDTAGDVVAAYAADHPVILLAGSIDPSAGWSLHGDILDIAPVTMGSAISLLGSMGEYYSAHPALDGISSYSNTTYSAASLDWQAEPVAYYADSELLMAQLDNVFLFNSFIFDGSVETNELEILYNIVRHMWCVYDRPVNAALLEDDSPWFGEGAPEHYLRHRRIPYDVIPSSAFGAKTDLSGYDFIIVSGAQANTFYQALEAEAAWLESWVEAGGVLLFNAAAQEAEWPTGLTLPTGVTEAFGYFDALDVNVPSSPAVSYPYDLTDATYFDNWNHTSHGYLTMYNGGNGGTDTLQDLSNNPVLAEYSYGKGHVVVHTTTVEYWAGITLFGSGDWYFAINLLSYLPPILKEITPASGEAGQNPVSVTATGNNYWYSPDTTVTVTDTYKKTDLPVSNLVIDSSDQLTFDLDLTGAPAGQYSVLISTPLGSTALGNGFTVTEPPVDDDTTDDDVTDDDVTDDDVTDDDVTDDDVTDDDVTDDDSGEDDDDDDTTGGGGGGGDDDDDSGCGC